MGSKRGRAVLAAALALAVILALVWAGPAPAGQVRAACWTSGGIAWARLENRGSRPVRVEWELWLDRAGWRQSFWTGRLAAGESRTFCLGRAGAVRPGRLETRGIF